MGRVTIAARRMGSLLAALALTWASGCSIDVSGQGSDLTDAAPDTSPTLDARVDSGVDAADSTVDTGAPDAPLDTGPPDTGPPDTGTVDTGTVDSCVTTTYYRDSDGDGFGDPIVSQDACVMPEGYVANAQDCNDGSDEVHPDADERCNAIDDDCSGLIDDAPAGAAEACPCEVRHRSPTAWPYLFCNMELTWVEARDQCSLFSYGLVIIEDSAEDAWLWSTASSLDDASWWTALRPGVTNGTHRWLDGTDASYTNFASGEPDGTGNCFFLEGPDGEWSDSKCGGGNGQRFYICEPCPTCP